MSNSGGAKIRTVVSIDGVTSEDESVKVVRARGQPTYIEIDLRPGGPYEGIKDGDVVGVAVRALHEATEREHTLASIRGLAKIANDRLLVIDDLSLHGSR